MFIGTLIKERLDQLDYSRDILDNHMLLDKDLVDKILDNQISLKDIPQYDLSVIANELYLSEFYFEDSSIRQKDLINNATPDSLQACKTIQAYLNDFVFLSSLN